MLPDGLLARLDLEEVGQLADPVPVRERARDVRPLTRVGALREQAAELVQARRRPAQDPVRVVVDEADRVSVLQEVTLLLECLVSG